MSKKYDVVWSGLDNGHEGQWEGLVWFPTFKILAKHDGANYHDPESPIYRELEAQIPSVTWKSADPGSPSGYRLFFRDAREPWASTGVVRFDESSKTLAITELGKKLVHGMLSPSDVFLMAMENHIESEEKPFSILAAALLDPAASDGLTFDQLISGVMQNFRPGVDNLSNSISNYSGSSFSSVQIRRFRHMLSMLESVAAIAAKDKKYIAWNTDVLKRLAKSDHMHASVQEVGKNLIYFGPPGTGKSTEVKNRVGTSLIIRTQFHPEYTHADLLGSYRPVVGSDSGSSQVVGHDGKITAKPVNYFAFVPGPLALALECAFKSTEMVFFIIEEINRGDCAAIFGDAFQLLDRDDAGRSEFGITPKSELLTYFKDKSVNYDIARDGKLYLPPNLSLLATMNTSDQSLYPMDSAFKRRWQWVACPIDFNKLTDYTLGKKPFLDDGKMKWDWIKLLEKINRNIVRDRMEDKQLGPWFIKPAKDGSVPWDAFLNKCLFYLWHDVFKDEQLSELSPFKAVGLDGFGEVQANIRNKGLSAGLKPEFLVPIHTAVQPSATEESATNPQPEN